MAEQYSAQKEKLVGYLINELFNPELLSAKSFEMIKNIIDKFYPDISNDAKADIYHKDLNDLEIALAS